MHYRLIFTKILLTLFSIALAPVHATAEISALIISTTEHYGHADLTTATKNSLEHSSIKSYVTTHSDIRNIDIDQHDIFITIGIEAIQKTGILLANKTTLSILPSENDLTSLPENLLAKKKHAFLFMTHGICRQLKFANLINHHWNQALILSSNSSDITSRLAGKCGHNESPKLVVSELAKDSNIVQVLNQNLKHADVLIALPDSTIYNSKTIKSILLTTYRHRVPVIGFSENMVKAGALTSLHSSLQQIGEDAASLVKHYILQGSFDKKYNEPSIFHVSSNKMVARSLSIPPPDNDILKSSLSSEVNNND